MAVIKSKKANKYSIMTFILLFLTIFFIAEPKAAQGEIDNGQIIKAVVSSGGQGYTYGMVDLGPLGNSGVSVGNFAKLIPIIPPSKGHGFNIYEELGTDRVLCYARFGGDNKDFPVDTQFAQVTLVKNPTSIGTTSVYFNDSYSSMSAIKFPSTTTQNPTVGKVVQQPVTGGTAYGYVASWDKETKVLKYIQDRSLYFDPTNSAVIDQTDYDDVDSRGKVLAFESSPNAVTSDGYSAAIETTFSAGIATVGTKNVDLGVTFTNGLASPEINKGSGTILYIDNRATIKRDSRQKEDIKIILEF